MLREFDAISNDDNADLSKGCLVTMTRRVDGWRKISSLERFWNHVKEFISFLYLVDLFGPWIQTAPSSSSRWERTAQKKVMEPTLNTPSVQLVVMVFLTNVRKWKWLPTFFGAQSNIGRLRFSRMWKLGFLGGSRSFSGVLGLIGAN